MAITQVALEYFEPDYFSPKELINMLTEDPWGYVFMGVYLGFSAESIKGFIKRLEFIGELMYLHGIDAVTDIDFVEAHRPKHIPTAVGTPFEGTGYIPTNTDLKKGYNATVREINARRFAPRPFPDYDPSQTDMKDIVKLIKTNPKFVDRLNETISVFKIVK